MTAVTYDYDPSGEKEERITIRVPKALKELAVAKSARTSQTITHICTTAIVRWVNQPDPPIQ